MGFRIFYTITLQAGCKFSLSIQMYGLHSPSRCWLFQNLLFQSLFFMGFDIFHTITLQAGCKFSLSKQMLAFSIFLIFDALSHYSYSHSPNRFKVHALHADVWFTLSQQMLDFFNLSMFHRISYWLYSQSPCRCLVNTLSLDIDVFIIQHFS